MCASHHGGMNRIGLGVDVHQFATGRKLIIGGVEIPYERGLEGHSDADVLAHAVADALLGAIGEVDIGHLFPNTDPKIKGISSMLILKEVAARVKKAGATVSNIDATLIAQEPKLFPHITAMKKNLAQALAILPTQIGIKATTSEWMGFTGRKEGMVAVAVALVETR
jgi:2-C-methyl-D-erythritol 2,4-cyclodiphosphate synthase